MGLCISFHRFLNEAFPMTIIIVPIRKYSKYSVRGKLPLTAWVSRVSHCFTFPLISSSSFPFEEFYIQNVTVLNITLFLKYFLLLCVFLKYIENAIPKVPHTPPPLPYPPIPIFLALASPCMRHIHFDCPMGLSFQWWPTRPSFDTYAARVKGSGVLVSS